MPISPGVRSADIRGADMSDGFLLTAEELGELTGFRRKSCQVAWLKRWGWPFCIDGYGRPKVDRAEYERRMRTAPPKRRGQPRLELIRKAP